MKKLLIILVFPVIAFTQTKKQVPDTCFTQQELTDISFVLDSLWAADDINNNLIKSYDTAFHTQNTLIKLDSIQLQYKDTQIKLLQDNIDLYVAREKLLQPKWYDKKGLWYSAGFLSALGAGILVNQLIK
jgi:hypothetical protein